MEDIRIPYQKIPLTYDQHIKLWEDRGLQIPDHERAEKYFNRISYYRLSAYAKPFQQEKDVFNEGANFENILNVYLFDRKLRLLLFDAIERIEVALRAQIVYQLAHKYQNSHWQDDPEIFNPNSRNAQRVDIFSEVQSIIQKNCSAKNPEVFIKHYKEKYNSPGNPPSWMCIELLTIGELSRLIRGLKDNSDRKSIADFFGLHPTVFESWLHTLTYARNLCAHHSRIWNREFAIKPVLPIITPLPWMKASFQGYNNRCFYFLCVLKYLLSSTNPNNHFKTKLLQLIEKYPDVPIRYMGIPPDAKNSGMIDWGNEPLWKD